MLGQVGKYLGDPCSRLPVLFPCEGGFHQRADLVNEEAGFFVQSCQLLPVPLGKLLLVIPSIDMAWTAIGKKPDYGFGLCRPRGGAGVRALPEAEASAERRLLRASEAIPPPDARRFLRLKGTESSRRGMIISMSNLNPSK